MVAVSGPTTGPMGQELPAIPASTWEILSNERFNPRSQPEKYLAFASWKKHTEFNLNHKIDKKEVE